jgi:hypothetical protein
MTTTEELKVVITAENKTAKAFGDVKKSTNILQKDVSGLVKTALGLGAAGGAAFLAFGISAVKGAADAQASLARVDTILKTMGESALKNRDALLQQAAAAVKLGFDDEAAAESLAKLYQRTGDLTKATELNNLAMDLARAKNLDLETASRMVGLVMSGNARALKEFGIEIDETLPPMAALGVLQEKVAGQSEAFAETFQGKMAIMSEATSNLKDAFGAALIEGLQPFVDKMLVWVQDPKNLETVERIATAVGTGLTEAFKVATLAMEGFHIAFDFITNQLAKFITFLDNIASKVEKVKSAVAGISGSGSSSSSKSSGIKGASITKKKVNDAVIKPDGTVIETHPDDWLFAMKNPAAMGGGVNVTINNPLFLDDRMTNMVQKQMVDLLKREMKL